MSRRRQVLALLTVISALTACSGKSSNAVAIQQKEEAAAGDSTMPTQDERSTPVIAAVGNLSAGAPGFVAKQIAGMRNLDGNTLNMDASVAAADTLIFNAESSTGTILETVNASLKEHKRVIVDSNATPEGRKAVKAALTKILNGASMEADAVVVTYLNEKNYNITPLVNGPAPAAGTGSADAGAPGLDGNTAANVLGLN
jgi:hypothetical protein